MRDSNTNTTHGRTTHALDPTATNFLQRNCFAPTQKYTTLLHSSATDPPPPVRRNACLFLRPVGCTQTATAHLLPGVPNISLREVPYLAVLLLYCARSECEDHRRSWCTLRQNRNHQLRLLFKIHPIIGGGRSYNIFSRI